MLIETCCTVSDNESDDQKSPDRETSAKRKLAKCRSESKVVDILLVPTHNLADIYHRFEIPPGGAIVMASQSVARGFCLKVVTSVIELLRWGFLPNTYKQISATSNMAVGAKTCCDITGGLAQVQSAVLIQKETNASHSEDCWGGYVRCDWWETSLRIQFDLFVW